MALWFRVRSVISHRASIHPASQGWMASIRYSNPSHHPHNGRTPYDHPHEPLNSGTRCWDWEKPFWKNLPNLLIVRRLISSPSLNPGVHHASGILRSVGEEKVSINLNLAARLEAANFCDISTRRCTSHLRSDENFK